MEHRNFSPTLVVHGGAGAGVATEERPLRKRAILAAARRGVAVLRGGGSALDAVIATVAALENAPLFNAGYGSVLNAAGAVEMDAAVMVWPATDDAPASAVRAIALADLGRRARGARAAAGAVGGVSRVRNPVMLARAVMERTPHVLMVGAGAERLAGRFGIERCRPEELISLRARERWLAWRKRRAQQREAASGPPGTVGAVALDARGALAAAASTGGLAGKLPGRVGDSALIGAGVFAAAAGAASATGHGEAIIKSALCHEAVGLLGRTEPAKAAATAIRRFGDATGGEAGVILVNRAGQVGYAHNARAMQVVSFDATRGIRHFWLAPASGGQRRLGPKAD